MPKSKDPCKAIACKIQKCLHENNYQEAACLDVLQEMKECCRKWSAISLCCSGIKTDNNLNVENETNPVK